MGVDFWDAATWKQEIEKHEVVFSFLSYSYGWMFLQLDNYDGCSASFFKLSFLVNLFKSVVSLFSWLVLQAESLLFFIKLSCEPSRSISGR